MNNMIVPCTYNPTAIESLSAGVSTCRLPNACRHHVYRTPRTPSGFWGHDSKAWPVGMSSQGNGCLSTLTSSSTSGADCSNDSSKTADDVVNMQAFVPVMPASLDPTKGGARPRQGAGYGGDLILPCVLALVAPLHSRKASLDHDHCSVSGGSAVLSHKVLGLPHEASLLDVPNPIPGKVFENHPKLVTTLSHWAAEWLYLLIIQPRRVRGHPFNYRGIPVDVCPALASLISRVIRDMQSPAQVIVHALWYITVLTGDEDFSETPVFHLLHSKSPTYAEDFLLQTFVVCAMVADKWVNDNPFPLKVWARVIQLPTPVLAAMESLVLQGLDWKVHMTPTQWKDMLTTLRSSEPSYMEFNPSELAPIQRRTIVVRILDRLARLADAMEACTEYDNFMCCMLGPAHQSLLHVHALQPIKPSAEFFASLEWCPEADPIVNKKPRIIGIAPGSEDQYVPKPLTVSELVDSILKPNHPTKSIYFPRPVRTSLHGGPFGAIGQRLAHTVNHSWSNWFPAQG